MTDAEVEVKITALVASFNNLASQLQETRHVIEQLGKTNGMEYSQDVKDWVLKSKLDELRQNPR